MVAPDAIRNTFFQEKVLDVEPKDAGGFATVREKGDLGRAGVQSTEFGLDVAAGIHTFQNQKRRPFGCVICLVRCPVRRCDTQGLRAQLCGQGQAVRTNLFPHEQEREALG